MSESASVRSINALDELRSAIVQFRAQAQESLQATAQEITRTFDWLAKRKQHWQNQTRLREEKVREARNELSRCEASGYRDKDGHYHQPDCSSEQIALVQARAHLLEAEDALRTVLYWTESIQRAADAYQGQVRRLNNILGDDTSKATTLLSSSADTLSLYATMGIGLLGLAAAIGSSDSSMNPPSAATPEPDANTSSAESAPPAHTPPQEPLGPATPAERREGSVGGPERRG